MPPDPWAARVRVTYAPAPEVMNREPGPWSLTMRAINHLTLLLCHLAGPLLYLAACRVDGYFVFPDSSDSADADPPQDWVIRLGSPGIERSGLGNSIAAAPNGDLVLVGSFQGTTMLGGEPITAAGAGGAYDIWIARYRPDGSHVWSIGMGGHNDDIAHAIAVDSAGDVYVVGRTGGAVNFGGGERPNGGGFIVKLSGANSAYMWDRTFGTGFYDGSHGITILDPGGVVMSGKFTGTINFGGGNHTATPPGGADCILVAHDSATGAYLWSRPLTSTGDERFDGGCNVIAVEGDVIAAGGFRGTATLGGASLVSLGGGEDVFVARFRGTDGSHVWSKRHGGISSDGVRALATDGARVYVGGYFAGAANFGGDDLISAGDTDAFVAAYSAVDGTQAWSRGFGGTSINGTMAIAASPSQLAATVYFVDPITIGTEPLTPSASDIENPDTAILRLDPENGSPTRAWHFGSTTLDSNYMAVTYAGRQLAGNGTFKQTTNLFGTTLMAVGNEDIAAFRVDF